MVFRKALRDGFVLLLAICLLPMVSCFRNPVPSESKKGQHDGTGKDNEDRKRLDNRIADFTEAIEKNPQEFDSRGELAYHRRGKA